MAGQNPIFSKLIVLIVPAFAGGLLAAGSMSASVISLSAQVSQNTITINSLSNDYGRVDERLKSIKETIDRILNVVEKN